MGLAKQLPKASPRIRIGVSACLLGEPVRFDSGHKRDCFVADCLAQYFELVPVCPEVAIGLGIPREPIRLVGSPQAPRAVGTRTESLDVTAPLIEYGRRMAWELGDISGYLFKSKSPSCGVDQVKLYMHGSSSRRNGRGLYAAELMRANPLLPVEEERWLSDSGRREHFIERLYAYRRWQDLIETGVTPETLLNFHGRHKLMLMAHRPRCARELGHLASQAGDGRPIEALVARYGVCFMKALNHQATRRRYADVLCHAMGYLERYLDSRERAELMALIYEYRQELVSLTAPVALMRHYCQRYPEPEMDDQLYLIAQPANLNIMEGTAP